MSVTDQQLLRDYVESGSEAAFAELVRRYVDLVYSVAQRTTGDKHSAEDVTQATFLAFARNASRLTDRAVMSGWLYRTVRNLGAKAVRADVRRRAREQQAAFINEMNSNDSGDTWQHIAPQLDLALEALTEQERETVLLRFFQQKSNREIGRLLGLSEETAQRRVSRAVERLRMVFARRGITVSAGALSTSVLTNAIQAAPTGLATAASSAATVAQATLGSNFLGAIMTAIRTKYTISTLIVLLLISAACLVRRNAALRQELASLRAQAPASSQTNTSFIGAQPGTLDEEARRRKEHLELLTLRGRIAQLSRELRARTNSELADQTERTGLPESTDKDSILFSALVTNRIPSGSALVVGGWRNQQLRAYLVLKPTIGGDNLPEAERLVVTSLVVQAPENFWSQIGWGDAKSDTRRSTLTGVLTTEQVDTLLQALKETKGATISNESVASRREGEYLGIGFGTVDDNESGMLMSIDVYPRTGSDGQSIDLELHPSPLSTNAPIHPSLTRATQQDQSRSP